MDVVWNKKSRGTGDGCVTVLWISSFGKWWSFAAPLTTVITTQAAFLLMRSCGRLAAMLCTGGEKKKKYR